MRMIIGISDWMDETVFQRLPDDERMIMSIQQPDGHFEEKDVSSYTWREFRRLIRACEEAGRPYDLIQLPARAVPEFAMEVTK